MGEEEGVELSGSLLRTLEEEEEWMSLGMGMLGASHCKSLTSHKSINEFLQILRLHIQHWSFIRILRGDDRDKREKSGDEEASHDCEFKFAVHRVL